MDRSLGTRNSSLTRKAFYALFIHHTIPSDRLGGLKRVEILGMLEEGAITIGYVRTWLRYNRDRFDRVVSTIPVLDRNSSSEDSKKIGGVVPV